MNPAISYIITSVQRSGTHLLCSILRSTGIAASPEEHFLCKPGETWEKRWGAPSRLAYVQNVLRQNTTANGVFGTVVMWSYFERMLLMLQEIPAYKNLNGAQLLTAVFRNPKYKSQPRGIPKFDFKVIDEWCNRIAAHDDGWANYFRENQIEPLILFYEDVVASHRIAAERILEFLELPLPPDLEIPPPAVEKQANQISHEWAACYLKLKKAKTGRLARILRRMRA